MPALRLQRIPEWSVIYEDRAFHFRGTIEEELDSGAWSGVDLSSASVSVVFRAWPPPTSGRTASDFVGGTPATLSKVSGGSTGKFDSYVTVTTDYAELIAEIVVVDSSVTSQPTPTTYREEVVARWEMRVAASVQP